MYLQLNDALPLPEDDLQWPEVNDDWQQEWLDDVAMEVLGG